MIYVVMGEKGEYSDRETWLVRAFKDEDAARRFVAECDAWSRELYSRASAKLKLILQEHEQAKTAGLAPSDLDQDWAEKEFVHPCDVNYACDAYKYARYSYEAVPFGDEPSPKGGASGG